MDISYAHVHFNTHKGTSDFFNTIKGKQFNKWMDSSIPRISKLHMQLESESKYRVKGRILNFEF